MTCCRRTRSPETAEDNPFRPDFRRIERGEIRLLDDQLEGFEESMTRLILLDLDDVNSHRNNRRLDLISRDAEVDASDVAVDGERSATPRHDAATWLLSNDDVFVSIVIRLDPSLSRSFDLLSVFVVVVVVVVAAVRSRKRDVQRIFKGLWRNDLRCGRHVRN